MGMIFTASYYSNRYVRENQGVHIPFVTVLFSKISPTHPWKVPPMFHQQFMKDFFLFGGFGKFGVFSQGMWAKSLIYPSSGSHTLGLTVAPPAGR